MLRYIRAVMAVVLAGSMSACLDLDVTNENLPDRRRALSNADDVESILGLSTWRRWYQPMHSLANIANPFPLIAGEAGTTATVMSVHWAQDPPIPYRNDELASQVWMPRHGYDQWSQCVSNANDAIAQINEGMRIMTTDGEGTTIADNTDRAWSWGKLWQGVCIGYLANFLDRFPIATEETELPLRWEDLAEWERSQMLERNASQHLPLAIEAIEDAIQRMETGDQWQLPPTWVPGQTYNNQDIIELAHTMIARILIYHARTPAERAAVDWDKVLYHTERGLTYDWGPVLQDGVITDPSYLARLNNTGSGSFRISYYTIGPADQSGGYQNWLTTEPREDADRFLIETPDRRITGDTPTSNGAYLRYVTATGGYNTQMGLQYRSWYGWWRRLNYQGANHLAGHFALATADENRLYRAEAMLRKGMLQEAADLINVTRTRGHSVGTTVWATNLPPVTPDGVPEVDGQCVPRRANGECGDIWDALMYERDIELMGIEPTRAWMDRRGFGQLRDGVWVELPIPARYLSSLGVPTYTFGGVGGDGAAVCTAPLTCLP
ncbi:MAG TPA: hypothetical protein VK929_03150 [Longimicrobiales bacterium]|nr:hypothetical protein [Longimicrobiales bacterium]